MSITAAIISIRRRIVLAAAFCLLPLGLSAQHAVTSYTLPSNSINDFIQDDLGYVWIATTSGLCRYNGISYQVYTCASDSLSLNDDNISLMFKDSEGDLWLSNQSGFAVWSHDRFRTPEHSSFNIVSSFTQLNDDEVIIADRMSVSVMDKRTLKEKNHFITRDFVNPKCAAVKQTGEIWVISNNDTDNVMYILDGDLRVVDKVRLPDNVSEIYRIPDENLMMLYGKGGAYFYRIDNHGRAPMPQWCSDILSGGRAVNFVTSFGNGDLLVGVPGSRPLRVNVSAGTVSESWARPVIDSKGTYRCFVDSDDNIWMSSDAYRFFSFNPSTSYCSTLTDELAGFAAQFVLTLGVDSNGYVWMRTMNDLASYDPVTGKIVFKADGRFGEFCIDDRDRLWILGFDATVTRYVLNSGRAVMDRRFTFNERPLSICYESNGEVWVASATSVTVIDEDDSSYTQSLGRNSRATGLYSSGADGSLFLATVNDGILRYNAGDSTYVRFDAPVKNPSCFRTASDGSLWIGSFNEGVYRYDEATGKITRWDTNSGLLENHVKTIIEDWEGNIWIGCPTTISRISVGDGSVSHIRDINYFKDGTFAGSAITRDGTLYYGGSKGITVIKPQDIRRMDTDAHTLPFYLEMFLAGGGDISSQVPHDGTPMKFTHAQNRMVFMFCALDYVNGANLNYSYILEGYDRKWSEPSFSRSASYTKIPAGKYTFRARVRNINGDWDANEIVVPFVVMPALYATWWAKLLYFILAVLAMLVVSGLYTRNRLKEERLRLAERDSELTREHVDFLTNISHELRTPLSLIVAPVTQLLSSDTLSDEDRQLTEYISRSTLKLSAITEKIMSTSRSDISRENPLKVAEGDLNAFVRAVCDNFRFITSEKGLKLDVITDETLQSAYFDYEKLERILDNLLSNAVKYTDQGGITVRVSHDQDNVSISVADTGRGIAEDKAKDIFSRYERLDMDRERPEIKGSGVGLHYALQLARLHKGDLVYRPSDGSSVFTLTIPCTRAMYAESEIDHTAVDPMAARTATLDASDNAGYDPSRGTVLIVEDNPDVREYLRLLLCRTYNVIEAQDGLVALDIMQTGHVPDLVISDVVMPDKDGFELCSDMKGSADFAAIPVILLTAKADMENRLKGFDCGADAYIEKPFNPFHILKQADALLNARARYQQVLGNLTSKTLAEITEDAPAGDQAEPAPQISERDRKFLEKFYANIESHISDGEYSVTLMSDDMNLSYSSLYARVKSLTGMTPQALFSTYRMNKAMELLKTGEYTISDVCYMVGASSLSNFNRSFKRQFGIPPSEVGR